jgi:RNA polymerase sigma-70 factor, ECF subfamily
MTMTLSRPTKQAATVKAGTIDLDEFFPKHWERICALLYRITGDEHEAQDLALEAFVRLYRNPPRSEDNLGGWLYRVATNLGFNALRARKRRLAYENEAATQELLINQPLDPAEAAEQSQEKQRVGKALKSMKPRLARVLVLRHSGLSYTEVAEVEGLSPGSVGTLLRRAEAEFEKFYLRLES